MSKKLKAIHDRYVATNETMLAAARDRADAVDTSGMTLGEGERARLFAATQLKNTDELIDSAVVVAKTKRRALILVGGLLYVCNKYGVMICTVPANHVIGCFNGIWGPGITYACGHEILERLGVTYEYDGRDDIYDYSACIIHPENKLAA